MPETWKKVLDFVRATGFTALLALAAWYFLPFKFFINLFWAVPLILLFSAYPLSMGVAAFIAAHLLLWLMLGDFVLTVVTFVEITPVVLINIYFFRNPRYSRRTALAIGCLTALAATFLATVVYLKGGGLTVQEIDSALRASVPEIIKSFKGALPQGITESELRESLLQSITLLERIFPGMLVTLGLWTGFFNYYFTHKYLEKDGSFGHAFPPYVKWQLPWYTVWGFIAGLGLSMAGDQYNAIWATFTGDNLLIAYIPVYILLGGAVAAHYYSEVPFPLLIKRIALLILILNPQFTLVILFFLGLFDNVFNLRRFKFAKPDDF